MQVDRLDGVIRTDARRHIENRLRKDKPVGRDDQQVSLLGRNQILCLLCLFAAFFQAERNGSGNRNIMS